MRSDGQDGRQHRSYTRRPTEGKGQSNNESTKDTGRPTLQVKTGLQIEKANSKQSHEM